MSTRRAILSLVLAISGLLLVRSPAAGEPPGVRSLRPDVRVRHVLDTGTGPPSVRIARDPRDNALYYLKTNGDIYQVDLTAPAGRLRYTSSDDQVEAAQGFAIGPDGTMYVVGNEDRPNTQTRATIVKGVPDSAGRRAWSILARTADYPRSNTAFDHRFNGIVVSPAGDSVLVNSGSRTDHGEEQSAGGLYPGTREVGLTACIFRLPARGRDILLPNDRAALKGAGYVFAEGTRNSFDLAFAPNGALFAAENGPDRDMSDELNWLRPGLHYGFPWRIGGADNPQQFPDYDPASDRLLDPHFYAVRNGYYHNDPTFPPRPAGRLAEPIVNLGPDADSFRDPQDGQVKDASALGRSLSTFTSHRAPLGLVFDVARAMGGEFRGAGFVSSWTEGDPAGDGVPGPFKDPSEDLLHLTLKKKGAGYTVRTTRIVAGFSHPIDAEIVKNAIYILEYGGNGGLWEVTMPARKR